MKRTAVLFDLDGTLIDSLIDMAEVVNMTRRFYGFQPVETEQVRKSIGKGVEFLVRGCFPEVEPVMVAEILKKHRELYRQYPHATGQVYTGVHETLEVLRKQGSIKVGVATNKPNGP